MLIDHFLTTGAIRATAKHTAHLSDSEQRNAMARTNAELQRIRQAQRDSQEAWASLGDWLAKLRRDALLHRASGTEVEDDCG